MGKLIDMKEKKYGKLIVKKRNEKGSYINGEALWECECSCEKKTIIYVIGSKLRNGQTTHCGCIFDSTTKEYKEEIRCRLESRIKWNGDCMEWTGKKDHKGYGKISITKDGIERPRFCHRVAWTLYRGEIPIDMCVCHKCDNPACFRIDHLFLGTQKDNVDDKMRKGRHRCATGEDSVHSKITKNQAKEILDMKGKGIQSYILGKKYGIAATTVKAIWQRRTWKHLN